MKQSRDRRILAKILLGTSSTLLPKTDVGFGLTLRLLARAVRKAGVVEAIRGRNERPNSLSTIPRFRLTNFDARTLLRVGLSV